MAGYDLSLFVLVSLAPACITWPTKFWWENEAHLLKLWTLVQRCVALRNEGIELQVVNGLFAFDMVRNKSVSLLGLLNLHHFIWGFGGATSIESWLLFLRAVSGFRHWSAAVALKQMPTCQSVKEQSFFGWEDYQSFQFQSNPDIQGWYKQHAVLSICDCPGKHVVFYGQPGGRRYIVQWFFYLLLIYDWRSDILWLTWQC